MVYLSGTGAPGMIEAGLNMIMGKEQFSTQSVSAGGAMIQIFNVIIFVVAMVLAFKCGKGKFFDVVMACCCSTCYVIYALGSGCSE